uniref:Palmitoyltransferase n=1 Tax=Panagrellus redivivus TaxID=6233 RepID=A0A7E4ZXI7_PANRE
MGAWEYIVKKFYDFQDHNFCDLKEEYNLDLEKLPEFSDSVKKWILSGVNFIGMTFAAFFMYGGTWFGYTYILPDIYPEDKTFFFWLAMFMLAEGTANLVCFHLAAKKNCVSYWVDKLSYMLNESEQAMLKGERVPRESDSNFEKTASPAPEAQGSSKSIKFCEKCNCVCPRRSHHCPICDYCVFRKDHHCYFGGGCVGLGNQRYFIVFLLYTVIGSTIVVYLLGLYLNNHVAPLFPFGFLRFIGPTVGIRYVLGYDDIFVAICGTLFTFVYSLMIGSIIFFAANIFYVLNGYTMHDYHTGRVRTAVKSDGENYTERIELVFGKHWLLNFLFPLYWNPNIVTPAIARNTLLAGSKDF